MSAIFNHEVTLSKERHTQSLERYELILKAFVVILAVAIVLSGLISIFMARLVTNRSARPWRCWARWPTAT